VARQTRSSVFHQRGWLVALKRTYNYDPFVLTSSPPGVPLNNGIVLCRISSWITGERAVSLPFADHCDPLVESWDDVPDFTEWLRAECEHRSWDYVEIRPRVWEIKSNCDLHCASSYCFHTLSLEPTLERIFCALHRDSIQRKIRRADREHLSYEVGCSEKLVDEFYKLVLKTRLRQGLIPQPRAWFRNLVACMGKSLQVRMARKNGVPIAALLTLLHKSTIVFKYGCSDESYHNCGAMPFLFWKLIEDGKEMDASEIDFGRSNRENEGLITFKDRFGSTRKSLQYLRYSRVKSGVMSAWSSQAMRGLLSALPASVHPAVGRVLYKHIG